MAIILSGKEIAEEVLNELRGRASRTPLSLAVLQVGEQSASSVYVKEKQKIAESLNIQFKHRVFEETVSQERLIEGVEEMAKDSAIQGMIIQLPLPRSLVSQEVLDAIPVGKDVDVLSSCSFGLFALKRSLVLPPTVHAVSLLLKKANIALEGKKVVIVGTGRLVGLPLILWMVQQKATVLAANIQTPNLREITQQADILISGTGSPGIITKDMVKEGAVVLDAGTSVEEGVSKGDVDFESVKDKTGYISPVPGGIGPLTVACLFYNLYELSSRTNPKHSISL